MIAPAPPAIDVSMKYLPDISTGAVASITLFMEIYDSGRYPPK